MQLRIITPSKKVVDREVSSVTVPSADGEITILPRHTNLFSLLHDGIITIRDQNEEEYMAIGGGYLETDGKQVQILVSRAYNQDEIDEKLTEQALSDAKKILLSGRDRHERIEAATLVRRSLIDLKLLKKRRKGARI